MIRNVKTKAINTRERERERERKRERPIKWVEYSYINPFSYN